jgi:uncharacterized protein YggE
VYAEASLHLPDEVGVVPSAMYSASDMAGSAKDVPIEPGQLDISASVVVVFELQ